MLVLTPGFATGCAGAGLAVYTLRLAIINASVVSGAGMWRLPLALEPAPAGRGPFEAKWLP